MIDPNDLGPPVYKYDQVVTEEDLRNILADLDWLLEDGKLKEDEENRCLLISATIEVLLQWIIAGKPGNVSFRGD